MLYIHEIYTIYINTWLILQYKMMMNKHIILNKQQFIDKKKLNADFIFF